MFDYLTKTQVINLKEFAADSINYLGWKLNYLSVISPKCLENSQHSFNEQKSDCLYMKNLFNKRQHIQ